MIRFLETADNVHTFPCDCGTLCRDESGMDKLFDENEFLTSFGDRYGYSGAISGIRKEEFGRFEGNKLVLTIVNYQA